MAIDWNKLESNAKEKDRASYEKGKKANAVLTADDFKAGSSDIANRAALTGVKSSASPSSSSSSALPSTVETKPYVSTLPLSKSMSFQRDLGSLSLGANPAMGALNTTVNKLTSTTQPLPSLPKRYTYSGQSYDQIQADIDRLNQDREQTQRQITAVRQQMAGAGRGWAGAKTGDQLQADLNRLNTHLNSIDLGLKVANPAAEQAMWREYSAIPSRPDYAQYAAQGAAIQNPSQREAEGVANLFGWRPGAQDVGNIVTYSRDNWESIALGEMGGSQMVGRSLYHYLTDDEVGIYNYLLAKEGKEAAQKYLDSMEETLNARFGYQQGENISGIENPVGRALTTGAYGFGAGVEQFGSGIKQLVSSDRLPTSPTQFASSYIRENLAQEGNTLGGIGYDLLNTAGNMAPSILLSSLTGGLGAPAAAAQGVGAAALGASVGGNAYNQALAEGYTQEQARNYGVLTAASEAALQYLLGGIGSLGGKLTGRAAQATIQNIDNALLRTAADIGFNMAGEGAEEYLQTILEPVYRNLIFDENNEVNLVSEDAAYSFLLGALSAGLMEGGGRLAGNTAALMQTRAQNRPASVLERVNEGLSQSGRVETSGTEPRVGTYLPSSEETLIQTLPSEPQTARQTQVETPPMVEQTAPVALPVPESSPSPLPEQTPVEISKRVEIPIQERTWSDVSNRKINAFQYDHPELRPYYQQAAREFQSELNNGIRGERFPILDADGAIVGYSGTKRSVSEPVEQARDNAGLSYAQIEKALNDLIADKGQENYAAAKKVELILDDMLSKGYTDLTGRFVPPDEAYIAARDQVNAGQVPESNEYRMSEEEWASLLGQEGPPVLERSLELLPDPSALSQNGPESSVGAARAGFDPYTHLQGQYGTIPPGEQPARTVDVPARTAPHNRVSRTARTVMEAAATPDAALPEIGQMVVDGRLSYLPVRNDQRTVMAENRIRKAGYQDALANWTSDVRSGKSSADLVATGAQLYNAAVNAGDTAQALNILYDYTKLIRSSAQATQAARILKTLTPSGTLYMIQKEVNNLNDTASKRKKGRSVSASENVPVELWMQRVGENLADHLAQRVNAPREQIQTVSQTILSDLRRYANETAPEQNRKKNKRTEMDRITDLFQNRTAYEEAWGAAKDTLSDTFENNPQVLAAFENWLDQSLDYTRALTRELTGQNEIIIPQDLADAYLSAETDQAREQALGDIYQSIADQIPADWKMKWNAWRYLAMLANPRTHIRNIVGNVGFQPLRMAKDRVAAAIEAGVSKATGGKIERTKSFAANPALYRVVWNDWANVRDALSGSKYNDASSQIESRRQVFTLPLLEGARKGNSALLELEDAVFKRLTYTDALAGYLQANGVSAKALSDGEVDTDLLSRARDYAGQEALKATYQDRNAVSDFLSSRYRGKGAGVINAATDAILPFRRTPANILVRGLEYSPAGLAKALTYDLVKVKGGELSAAQAIDHIAAGLTGSGLMALGFYLFAQGLVSSGGGDDDGQDAINDLTGGQNYALNLPGGGSVTLDWLAPEALPFFMGVELMESMGKRGSTADSILNALKSVSEPMLELSMLQSLNDAIESVSFSENKLGALASSALVSYFSQAIPTVGGQIERTAEDRRMTTYTDKNFPLPTDLQYALGRASSRIPGWDYQQVPYIDAWGREERTGTLPMRAFNNFLSPAYTSSLNVTPVDAEIQRLYNQSGDSGVVPERPDRYITVDQVRKNLSGQEYIQYATQRGQTQYTILEDLLDNSSYQGLSDTDKTAVVKDVYAYTDAVAKAEVSDYELDGWIKKAVESGVDPAAYILYRHSLGDSGITLTDRVQEMERKGITGDEQTNLLLLDNPEWVEKAGEAGVSAEIYADFKVATAGITGDKDRDGNTISGSKREKVLAAINGLNISRREKDALYYASGYGESTLHQAPWH